MGQLRAPRTCAVCGEEILRQPGQLGATPRYCSDGCRRLALGQRQSGATQPDFPTTCRGCGTSLPPRKPGQRVVQKWCSKNCEQRVAYKPKQLTAGVCKECGVEFMTFHSQKIWCSTRCAEVARGLRRPEPLPQRKCALDDCDVVFVPTYGNQRCCCEAHGKKNWHREAAADGRKKPDPWSDRKRDASHRRRARLVNASTGEPVRLAQIAERDRWVCYLCGGKVRKTLKWPNPLSPSLDHVVPLIDGGPHDPSNVRLAHLTCNIAKGRRGGGEQLMLIG